MKYRKKPVVIEAIEWTGDYLREVIDFIGKHPRFDEWFPTWDAAAEITHLREQLAASQAECMALQNKLREATEWRDIKDAPKDGTQFDALDEYGERRVDVWFEDGCFYTLVDDGAGGANLCRVTEALTHYFPLPAPPK